MGALFSNTTPIGQSLQEHEITIGRNWAERSQIQGAGNQLFFGDAEEFLKIGYELGTLQRQCQLPKTRTYLSFSSVPIVDGDFHRVTVSRIQGTNERRKQKTPPQDRIESITAILRLRDNLGVTGIFYSTNYDFETKLPIPVLVGIPSLGTIQDDNFQNYAIKVAVPSTDSAGIGINPLAPKAIQYYALALANSIEILQSANNVLRGSL